MPNQAALVLLSCTNPKVMLGIAKQHHPQPSPLQKASLEIIGCFKKMDPSEKHLG